MNSFAGLLGGMNGVASAGAFGAGRAPYLGGAGTAIGGGEFSSMQNAGGGLNALMGKLQNMTPEQQQQLVGHLAQFAAPPQGAMPSGATPMPVPQTNYASFVNPGMQTALPQLRTPMGIGG